MNLLTTKMTKADEDYIASIEDLAVRTEAARDALADELEILRKDTHALRETVRILLAVDCDQKCIKCGDSSGSSSICEWCQTKDAALKVKARLRIA